MLTMAQKRMIRESFEQVQPNSEAAAQLFYGRPFELDPSLRAMFRGDLAEQGRHLMQALAVVVKGLDYVDELLPAVRSLGRRQAAYGVRDEYYVTVGAALLWTLERGLGDSFTGGTRRAWESLYYMVASCMVTASREAAVATAT
jgi:hemoglobin-like flavoprotein